MPQGSELITEQQAKWLEARSRGASPVEAAKEAGYKDPYNAAFRLSRNQTLLLLNNAIGAAHGVDLVSIFQTIQRLMGAQKLIKATYKGQITDERLVDDGDIQLRAAELAIELLGLKPAEEHKLVKEDDGAGPGFLVPEHFRDMAPTDLLRMMQQQRQAQVSGMPMPTLPMKQVEAETAPVRERTAE